MVKCKIDILCSWQFLLNIEMSHKTHHSKQSIGHPVNLNHIKDLQSQISYQISRFQEHIDFYQAQTNPPKKKLQTHDAYPEQHSIINNMHLSSE